MTRAYFDIERVPDLVCNAWNIYVICGDRERWWSSDIGVTAREVVAFAEQKRQAMERRCNR